MCGRRVLLAVFGSFLLLVAPAASPARTEPVPPHAVQASAAFADLEQRFGLADGLYREDERDSYASAWPLSQALAAALALAHADPTHRDDAVRMLRALAPYWNGTAYDSEIRAPYGPGGADFYDDNEWVALDLVAAYRLLGDGESLRRAQALFEFVVSGWDWDPRHACPGGVFWTADAHIRDRNTVSTANGALLALQLYRETRDPRYLTWGRRMYGWVARCLRAPDGLYWDHLSLEGTIEPRQWSYNQGAMVAAGALLARATGKKRYLDEAATLARLSLARYGSSFADEPREFVAIFLCNLGVLDAARPNPAYRAAGRAYAAEAARQPAPRTLIEQAALVQLYAQLATA